jgi:hypothetical protein
MPFMINDPNEKNVKFKLYQANGAHIIKEWDNGYNLILQQ